MNLKGSQTDLSVVQSASYLNTLLSSFILGEKHISSWMGDKETKTTESRTRGGGSEGFDGRDYYFL